MKITRRQLRRLIREESGQTKVGVSSASPPGGAAAEAALLKRPTQADVDKKLESILDGLEHLISQLEKWNTLSEEAQYHLALGQDGLPASLHMLADLSAGVED